MSNTGYLRQTENFEKMIRVMRLCAKILGVDVLNPKYKMNFMTYFLVICFILFFGLNINTISRNISDDWEILLGCSCTLGAGLMGLTKLCSAIGRNREYHQLYIILSDIYKTYEPKGLRYQQAMRNCTKKCGFIFRIVGLVYVQLVVLSVVLSIATSLYKGKRYNILHFGLPGVDTETDFGYWLLFGFHMVFLFNAGFGLFAGDLFIMTSFTHALLFVDIFETKIIELNESIDDDALEADDESNTEEFLKDIVCWHQKYFDFTDHCNKIFNSVITVQIFCATSSIVLTIFIIWTRDWPMAYAYLFFGFNSLYEYCLMGTLIEICNDKFIDAIYQIHWYNLTISQQKMVVVMLNRSQSPQTITIAGVLPLSVNTGLSITRSIYSIVMMMVQFY